MTPLSKILIFMKIGMLILFFLILSAPSFSASTSLHSIQEQEAEALLKWKDSLDDSNHTRSLLSSWKLLPRSSNFSGNFHSHCKWVGITCDELGSVIHIKLNDSSLRGTLQNFRFSSFRNLLTFVLYNNSLCGSIPSHISNLSRLTYLDLSDNQLSGNIPSEIGLLTSLQCLYLYENHLTGSIPASIGNLSKLITLDLTGNKITGSIPREIEKLKSLAELYMYINHLTGSIPPSIGNLSMLTTLGLGQNNITGSIPHEVEQLKSIKVLDLYDNYLSGSIPASIGNLRSLTALSLFDNNLTGSIPLEMNNLTDLETLQFSDNFLSGYLPQNVCLGGRLKWFVAGYNAFRGSIPKSLRNCSTLLQLSLSMNLLTGNISKELGIYPRLDYMDLSNNKFVGKLTGNWSQYHNLTMLNFSNNKISGRLPPELGKAAQLRKLDLSSNLLVGNIPKELGLLKHLYFLKLNHNALSGKVPREMGMLFDLEQLDIAENKLNGPIPIHLGQCSKLQYMNLRDNRFNGSVPFQIGNLQTLRGLDLSQNFLTGDLPMELGYLRMLETLNLSHNKFTGSVPSTFKDMLSLTSVDMSYNQLQGPLPGNKAFTMATLGNNKGLCGNNTSLKPCPTPKNGKGRGLAILIVVSVFGTLGLLFIIVGILFCCKHIERNVEEPTETQNETFFSTWNHDGKKVHEEIVKATENFSSKYCIGVGGYGSVYKALLSTGQVVAVKKFHENGGEASKKAFTSEISVLTIARHRNIIKLYGYCSHVRHTFLVYEFMEKGSLANMLSDKVRAIELEWSKRVNVVKGLANALFYLHHECSPAIIHRDISSNNVLLDEQYEAHLADFGTGRTLVHESSSNWSSFAGTFGYSAPELAYATPANEKCDVYSFGVITLEVIMGKHPGDLISSMLTSSLPENFHQILLKDVLDQRLLPPKNQIAEEVVSVAMLAFACLLRTPQSRPDMKQVSRKLSTSITSSSNPLSTISLAQILNPQHI